MSPFSPKMKHTMSFTRLVVSDGAAGTRLCHDTDASTPSSHSRAAGENLASASGCVQRQGIIEYFSTPEVPP